jgi:hypothetical protein
LTEYEILWLKLDGRKIPKCSKCRGRVEEIKPKE